MKSNLDGNHKTRFGEFIILLFITLFLFIFSLAFGQTQIPLNEIFNSLFGEGDQGISSIIILESRLPFSVTALLAGAALSVAGLILQTVFHNPLAGPSVLGVSAGSSLGVAIVMMSGISGALFIDQTMGNWFLSMIGAIIGSLIIICLLLFFSSIVRNGVMLLILGIMVSYLSSSIVSLLSYVAPAESLKSFTIWGLGSYAGVTLSKIPLFSISIGVLCIISLGCIKPLNALLLGERYASSMGYNIRSIRALLLLLSGFLTAFITAYCGPIAFIGLIVPHIARICFRTSDHSIILPACLLIGASVSLFCAILSNGILNNILLPINVVTPIIGVPMIFYIILRSKKLPYFR